MTSLKPHVLRYWESQFRFLNPAKNRSGNRVYQRREVDLIMLVKHLLYDDKYTIEGARQKVEQHRKAGDLRRWHAARSRFRRWKPRVGSQGAVGAPRRRRGGGLSRSRNRRCGCSSRTTMAFSRTDIDCLVRRRRAAGRGDRRRARSRAERHEPLAHAPPSRAADQARRAALAGRRHADRLRHARARGADA